MYVSRFHVSRRITGKRKEKKKQKRKKRKGKKKTRASVPMSFFFTFLPPHFSSISQRKVTYHKTIALPYFTLRISILASATQFTLPHLSLAQPPAPASQFTQFSLMLSATSTPSDPIPPLDPSFPPTHTVSQPQSSFHLLTHSRPLHLPSTGPSTPIAPTSYNAILLPGTIHSP